MGACLGEPPVAKSIDTNTDIFKATFGGSFGSMNFGNVAQAGLPEAFLMRDLTIAASLAAGGDLGSVELVYVPEPSSALLLSVGLAIGLSCLRRAGKRGPSACGWIDYGSFSGSFAIFFWSSDCTPKHPFADSAPACEELRDGLSALKHSFCDRPARLGSSQSHRRHRALAKAKCRDPVRTLRLNQAHVHFEPIVFC
jgi:hypothetical protein